jgi:hypothetical protein
MKNKFRKFLAFLFFLSKNFFVKSEESVNRQPDPENFTHPVIQKPVEIRRHNHINKKVYQKNKNYNQTNKNNHNITKIYPSPLCKIIKLYITYLYHSPLQTTSHTAFKKVRD